MIQVPDTLQHRTLLPGDERYDRARAVWNAMVDRRPKVIVQPATPGEVVTAIRFARDNGLEIGVRCGGHSVVGHAVPDGGLMLDLTNLRAVTVDPGARRARVGGGALLGDLDREAQRFGLATTAGNVSHTGVGGLTLGGGMGWLARRYGLSCDNIESYEVVTADGDVVRATADEHPDLFWALRGGGGNFGIVTEFEFRLHPTGTVALSADFDHDVDAAGPALRAWADLIPDAPRDAVLTAWVGRGGGGRMVATIGCVWVGDPAAARPLVDTIRGIGQPIEERVDELSYVELQTREDGFGGSGYRRYWKGHYLKTFTDAAIEAFLAIGEPEGSLHASLQSYGGAVADVAASDSAFAHRDTLVEYVASAAWTDPAHDELEVAAGRAFGGAMEPFASGAYVNALGEEGAAAVARAYGPEHIRRLGAVKASYDPDNVFHLNHNIQPQP